jgi:predicted phage terminase large subunit-like protein
MPLVIRLPKLHSAQAEVAKDGTRFRVLVCGRRWGKTRLGAVLALKAALEGKRVWWVAPTYSISGIAWEQVRAMARPLGASALESLRTLRFPAGGFVAFKSADNPDNLRGEGLDFLVMDEADFVVRRVWEEVLRPALADRKGKALIISTPNIEGGWFHELVQRGQGEDPEVRAWQLPSWTNPHLDGAEIDAARGTLPAIVFRREFGAEFVSAAGALLRREWVKTGEAPPLEELEVAIGVDLAISTKDGADWTAAVALGRDGTGNLWVLDVARARLPFHQVLSFIQGFSSRWNPRAVAVEQVQFQAAVVTELLRTTNLPVIGVRPDRDKVTRFTGLQARFEQGMVWTVPGLMPEFARELLGFPVADHDDMVDALVYAHRALGHGGLEMS